MNTRYLFLLILISSSVSFTQTYLSSGLFNVSGSAAFSYSKSEQSYLGDITEKEIKIAPAVSYFLINKLSISVELAYNYYEKNFDTEIINSEIEMFISFGPVIKYYLLDNNISPFIKAGYLHNIYNITDYYSNNRKSFPGFSAEIGIGLNYFITNNFAVEPSLNYVFSQKQIEIYAENSSTFIYSNKKLLSLILVCYIFSS